MEYFFTPSNCRVTLEQRTGNIWMVFPNTVSEIPETNLH